MDADPFHLDRFLTAQADVYDDVIAELTAGVKRTHWMWFVFPQLAGLGSSTMAQRYAISGLDEATAYLAHPLLGRRLVECTHLVVAADEPLDGMLGSPDDLKFHSSMTLFAHVDGHDPVIDNALARYFHGELDQRTVTLLRDQ
jgi:uncharacterized protein (DUF1810 family)